MTRTVFVHGGPIGFVNRDRRWFDERFENRTFELGLLGALRPSVIRAIARSELLYCWFAGRHAVIPILIARIAGVPSLIVAGGWDVASEPEISYGLMRGGASRFFARFVLRMATHVISVSEFNREEAISNGRVPSGKIHLVPHGFEDTSMRSAQSPLKHSRDVVLSVGEVRTDNLLRKGHRRFAEAAALATEGHWVLAGRIVDQEAADLLDVLSGGRLKFTGYLQRDELIGLMREARIYVQPSVHEAFGCSVAEAMVEGCVPVVSSAGALPEVVGSAGIILGRSSPDLIAETVDRLLRSGEDLTPIGESARERILTSYSESRWSVALSSAVHSALDGAPAPSPS